MAERVYPIELLRSERSLIRLKSGHVKKQFFTDQSGRLRAGFHGEQAIDQHLKQLLLPGWWRMIRDVRLQINEGYVAQFDTLLLTERGIWIVEAKRINGTLRWKNFPRRVERVKDDGSILTFDCPIIQLENQKTALRGWLQERNLSIPVHGVVAFSLKNTWINLPDNSVILSVKELRSYLTQQVNTATKVYEISIERIAVRIHEEQLGPDLTTTCERHEMEPFDFMDGLLCRDCGGQLKQINERSHTCTQCGQLDAEEPVGRALLDYVLIRKSVVNTQEFARFAGCSSSVARRTLSRHLDRDGKYARLFKFCPRTQLNGTEWIKKKGPIP